MGRHRLTQTALAQANGLRPATISALYHDRTDAIAKGTLTRLLAGLHHLTGVPYQVGDILQLRQ
ncbi:helix-turn-helix transcriptional regulator [Deinococcus sp. JMULE3]|uniref:helix-turn-helix domain-containing protein n=1 Tax=Deinococcus sp. JMULE3 TaxID=2518341 RepID=UPI001C2DB6A5|nr:helix-turn-helix transcriptional regulator [Deinococcus sp. JMULE3]